MNLWALRKGDRGIHKIDFGAGTGTVQQIKSEMEEA